MSVKFNVGDKVRYNQSSSSSQLKKDQIYTVSKVGECDDGTQKIYLEGYGMITFWYGWRFDLVSRGNNVSVAITGEIVGRNADVVTIKTEDGTSVLVPASLVPEDPKLVALRAVMVKFAEKAFWHVAKKSIADGNYNEQLAELLPEFTDAVTRAS